MPFARTLTLDATVLIAFAALGRRTHDERSAVVGTLTVAAPFLIGWAIGAVLVRLDRQPTAWQRAIRAWAVALPLALALRALAFGRGVAPGFVVVALVFTLATLVGWRLLAGALDRRVAD